MTLEQQVPSLELCIKLKEAGYPQESLFCFYPTREEYRIGLWNEPVKQDVIPEMGIISAPTAAELGEMLCGTFFTGGSDAYGSVYTEKIGGSWLAGFLHLGGHGGSISSETEANARARMWLYLKEKGLL